MNSFDIITQTKQFQELLSQVPEDQREKVLESLRKMSVEFEQNILKPLETLIKR